MPKPPKVHGDQPSTAPACRDVENPLAEMPAFGPACRRPAPLRKDLCDRTDAEPPFDFKSPASLKLLEQIRAMPFSQRLECISRRFIGIPYVEGSLGEGRFGEIDRRPRARFDQHDCMTYVEHVMALAVSSSPQDFLKKLDQIRYYAGLHVYWLRKHFVLADWLPDNKRLGYLREITKAVAGDLAASISSKVNRTDWIKQKMRSPRPSFTSQMAKLAIAGFRRVGLEKPTPTSTDYIPFDRIFLKGKSETSPGWKQLVERLPEVSLVLFIRTEESAKKRATLVSHMGLVIVPRHADGTRGEPILRHPTKRTHQEKVKGQKKRVTIVEAEEIRDEPFLGYLEFIKGGRTDPQVGIAFVGIEDPAKKSAAPKNACTP